MKVFLVTKLKTSTSAVIYLTLIKLIKRNKLSIIQIVHNDELN